MAELVILGVHGAFRNKVDHCSTAAAIICGDDVFLIDCGVNTLAMLPGSFTAEDVTGVFITHCHGDHVSGIEELAFRQYYMHGRKLPVIAPEPVWEELHCYLDAVLTPYNTREGGVGHLLSGIVRPVSLPTEDRLITSPSLPWRDLDAGLRVVAEPVQHVPKKPCYSYHVTFEQARPEKSIWWSGDCVFDAELITKAAEGKELIFCDCSMGKPYRGTVHAHYEELVTLLPEDVRRKLIPIHHNQEPDVEFPGLNKGRGSKIFDSFSF